MGADVTALPAAVIEQLLRHPSSEDLRKGRPS